MNDASFEDLYRKYFKTIVRFINVQYQIESNASKDIAQEVFTVLWEKREELDFDDERKIFKWLCETAKRKSWEYNRKNKKVLVGYFWDPETISDNVSAKYEDLIHIEGFESTEEKYQSYLGEIKKHLNKKECKIFTLVVEDRLDAREVAVILKVSDVNFRVKWCRLRKKLKPIVKKIIEK